jgi:hypothetical protein
VGLTTHAKIEDIPARSVRKFNKKLPFWGGGSFLLEFAKRKNRILVYIASKAPRVAKTN